jgi:hypothetical protein
MILAYPQLALPVSVPTAQHDVDDPLIADISGGTGQGFSVSLILIVGSLGDVVGNVHYRYGRMLPTQMFLEGEK